MPSIDWPLAKCREYQPALTREPDFDAYWDQTLTASAAQPLHARFHPYPVPFKGLRAFKVTFDGFHGGRIAGHYVRPESPGRYPAVMIYHGYSGRAPRPVEMLHYAYAGIVAFSMDTRGQNGDSTDAAVYPEGHHTGWMTKGLRDPRTYYYRNAYADAVRALDLLASREEVDPKRIAVTGISQGGGLCLAAAALSPHVALCQPDIPFLCDFPRSIEITPAGPYPEFVGFLKQHPHLIPQAFKTLSYVDNVNLAPRITARTHITVGMQDDICPPSTIFGTYNHISAPKDITVYPYHKHEVTYEGRELQYKILLETLKP